MGVPDLETYLQETIEGSLKSLLGNRYIITEDILKEFPSSVRKSFADTYCYERKANKSPKAEIPVSFTYTETKDNLAQVLIQYKGGTELVEENNGNSLGLVNGMGNAAYIGSREEHGLILTKQRLTLEGDSEPNDYLVVTLKAPIAELQSLSISSDTSYLLQDNLIILPYLSYLEGALTDVVYLPNALDTEGDKIEQKVGIDKGYNVMENYTIDTLSNNIDTLRCLNAILKVIFVTMKLSARELQDYRLNTLQFQGIDLLEAMGNADTTAFGNQIYYRRTEVSYQVTYSMNYGLGKVITSISADINNNGMEEVINGSETNG